MVEKPTYVLPNRVGYLNYLFNHFHPKEYAYSDKVQYPHQKFVKDYLHHDTPYKGLYLYFLPGTGKTKASIEVIRSFHEKGKHAFVFLPASLEENYRKEIIKHGYPFKNYRKKPFWTKISVSKKTTPDVLTVLKKHYHSSLNASPKGGVIWLWNLQEDTMEMIKSAGGVIDERLVGYPDMNQEDKLLVDHMINMYINTRYTFVHYNGLNSNVISKVEGKMDNSIIVFDEIHKFILTVSNKRPLALRLYNAVVQAKNSKILLLSGTPLINKPFELANLINMVRGPTTTYVFKVPLEKRGFVEKSLRDSDIWMFIDTYRFQEEDMEVILLPFPFVKETLTDVSVKSDVDMWKKTKDIVGTLKKVLDSKSAKVITNDQLPFPNKEEEFNEFFLNNSMNGDIVPKEETMSVFERQILGSVAYYGREGDDYPEELPEIVEKINMSEYQFEKYMVERLLEIKQEENNKKKKMMNQQNQITETYKVFSRMACNFVFPQGITRPKPSVVKKDLLLEISKVDVDMDDEDDPDDQDKDDDKAKGKYGSKDPAIEYQNRLKAAIKAVEKLEDDKFNINDCSPKYKRILENIEKGVEQKALVYSQFRTVEGIGMFGVYLRRKGYVEIELVNTKEGFVLKNPQIMDKKYDHKRYCVFDDDRMKTSAIINLYNGKYDELSDALKAQIRTREENLRGSLAKIMLITGSAAEGISFFNVRSVHIMEPYWNDMVIEQVIGRAIRNRSHIKLPKEDRTVQAYRYIMTSKSQDHTFRMKDESKTTDENIQSLAISKRKLNDPFINALIRTSINCAIHAKTQKNACYNIPVNLDPTKVIQMDTVAKEASNLPELKMARSKKVSGVYKEGVVKADYNPRKDYDVDAFVYAKQLIEKKSSLVKSPSQLPVKDKTPKVDPKNDNEKKKDSDKMDQEENKDTSPPKKSSSSKKSTASKSQGYTLVDVSGSGNCFPRALYGALKNNGNGEMLGVFANNMGLSQDAVTTDDKFVKAFRNRFGKILRSKEDKGTTTTFKMLNDLGDKEAKRYLADEFYGEGSKVTTLKNIGLYPIPKTEITFRDKLATQVEKNGCYLNSLYINILVDELSKDIRIDIQSEDTYKTYITSLNPENLNNRVILVRVNQNHYNYILFK